ncbi:type III pantothenate kinase [Derxia gummosa]|uniref:Type III pantothenate kinase n=1 Tax=Derxia gummosa DSM 723 TaxID=1121388 RepID=A0A8B6X7L2_9BURK|nr:type III pantothenate kinase [Derxia gummosa]
MKTILAVDVGNTRVKWALRESGAAPGRWLAQGAGTAEALVASLRATLPGAAALSEVVFSSVAGEAVTTALEQALRAAAGGAPVRRFVPRPAAGGLANRYAAPTLGADRFAAAIGARRLYGDGALVVACFGTATTIDTVSPAHDYLGGLILPGVDSMLAALATDTARLPRVAPGAALVEIPDTTEAAIAEGVARAQAGAVRETVEIARRRFGAARLVISGGAAPLLLGRLGLAVAAEPVAPASEAGADIPRFHEDLVLVGLAASAEDEGWEPA